MTYPQAISYLESFINYEKLATYPYKESLKLERVRGFLDIIGNPQEALRCIHIAGSKGKGSTAAYITYILRAAGFKTGLYTSPHLSDFRERIRILSHKSQVTSHKYGSYLCHKSQVSAERSAASPKGSAEQSEASPNGTSHKKNKEFEGMIPKAKLAGLVERLKPAIEKYNKISKYGELSFFEVYTALAFLYFKERQVDFAVLETGLGGRLDATNTCNSLVSVITPISYEHTQKLGKTLAEIAREKSGIIKGHKAQGTRHKVTVISAPQENEALQVIRRRCQETGARLYEIKKPLTGVKLPLLGRHQKINAAVASSAVKALRGRGFKISDASIREGLRQTLWPARCEVVGKDPLVVLDGAQNAASAKAIREAVKDNFKFEKLILVLGVSKDKDIKGICGQLRDSADKVILTKADNPRALEPEELVKCFRGRGRGREIHITASVKEAKRLAKKIAAKKDLILFTGSLFVAGEAR